MATKASKVSTTGTNGINYMGSQWETGESPRQNYDQKNIRMSDDVLRNCKEFLKICLNDLRFFKNAVTVGSPVTF